MLLVGKTVELFLPFECALSCLSLDLAEKVRPHMATTVTDLFQKLLQSGILTQAQATSSSSSNQRKIGAAERLPLPPIRLVLTELKE